MAGRTSAEYYIHNVQKIKEYHRLHFDTIMERKREYYASNKERLLQWNNEYRERHRSIIHEKARDYCARNRDRRKKEREECKDEINERRREYRGRTVRKKLRGRGCISILDYTINDIT